MSDKDLEKMDLETKVKYLEEQVKYFKWLSDSQCEEIRELSNDIKSLEEVIEDKNKHIIEKLPENWRWGDVEAEPKSKEERIKVHVFEVLKAARKFIEFHEKELQKNARVFKSRIDVLTREWLHKGE